MAIGGVGTFFGWGEGGGRKYKIKVSFCQKMVNHLHQLVISMEARSYTICNQLF